jgi:hypothetical protein
VAGKFSNTTGAGMWERTSLKGLATWAEARDECLRLGMDLPVVLSQTDNDELAAAAGSNSIWLGATDSEEEGVWKWVDGSPVVFEMWNEGEPNNFQGNEDVIEMKSNGRWNDHHGSSRPFICANPIRGCTPCSAGSYSTKVGSAIADDCQQVRVEGE